MRDITGVYLRTHENWDNLVWKLLEATQTNTASLYKAVCRKPVSNSVL